MKAGVYRSDAAQPYQPESEAAGGEGVRELRPAVALMNWSRPILGQRANDLTPRDLARPPPTIGLCGSAQSEARTTKHRLGTPRDVSSSGPSHLQPPRTGEGG